MPSNKKLLQAAAGNAGESLYVEDVFSTYLYTGGLSSPNVIQTGIDLAGEGGLVWTKNRTSATSNQLTDTVSGYRIESDDTAAGEASQSNVLFNSDGHSLSGYSSFFNGGGDDYASWTFRKAEKFFDVVTYTGNGTAGRTVAHNLGSVPACIIVKRTDIAEDWRVYHVGLDPTDPEDYGIELNNTNARGNQLTWNNTAPTDSVFSLSQYSTVNGSGGTYVAYLFASDAGGFGDDGSESIIKCGSYTGNGGSSLNSVTLGFEPQWILLKNADATGSWAMYDTMRGWAVSASSADDARLFANSSGAESLGNAFNPTATGFEFQSGNATWNNSGNDFIYIAIRRPMKTPESGAEVFAIGRQGEVNGGAFPAYYSGIPVDAQFTKDITSTNEFFNGARLIGGNYLDTTSTAAEVVQTWYTYDYMDGFGDTTNVNTNFYSWMFKRAAGFMDAVAYSGSGVTGRTVNHNLGVKPELIISKRRDTADNWWVGQGFTSTQVDHLLLLQSSSGDAISNDTYPAARYYNEPTSTSYTIAADSSINGSGGTYIAYLFATLDGVSKVGSYTGTGADLNVDCGFSAGARFILIKRTDSTGDWYVWDSLRGIVAGNDPYLLLNTTAAEVTNTDYVDPLSSGFTVTSTAPAGLNASGGIYIFLAIS